MVQFTTFFMLGAALLALPTPGFSASQDASKCPGGSSYGKLYGSLQPTRAGRKIAIVIDSSGSNMDTDPNNVRIAAAKAFNDLLISKQEAGANGKSDLVTVVDFDSTANVLYKLGDPAGADSAIDVDSMGGTSITSGLEAAISELTKKGYEPTAKRTGIIVLTDGQDSDVTGLIEQINKAKSLGIRVNFGFLESPPPIISPPPPTDLLTAILSTGGIHSSINSAEAQQYFVDLVAARGPTELDGGAGSKHGAPLLPGLKTSGLISEAASATFTYFGQAGEKLNFTIESLSNQELKSTLSGGNQVLKTAKTNSDGVATMLLNLTKETKLKLVIEALSNGTSKGVFSVAFNSSIPFSNCHSTINSTNSTNTTHHQPTLPPTFISGSSRIMLTSEGVMTGISIAILGLWFTLI